MQTQAYEFEVKREKFDIDGWKESHQLAALVEDVTGQSIVKNKIRCIVHADDTPSMHIYDDGHFKCFGCGVTGDALDFLGYAWYGPSYDPHSNLREVIDRLSEPGFRTTIRDIPSAARPNARLRPTLDPNLADQLEERLGERELEYWRKRGIPPSVIFGMRVGWTGYQHPKPRFRYRYAFPWFYRGILTGIKLRRDDDLYPDMEPKYISEDGSRFTAPYNIDAVLTGAPRTVLIAEDEKSVLAALRYRLTAIAAPAHAFRQDWVGLLSDVEQIVIVADNDEEGLLSAQEIQRLIKRARVTIAPEGKDLFDYHLYLHERIGDADMEKAAMLEWLEVTR